MKKINIKKNMELYEYESTGTKDLSVFDVVNVTKKTKSHNGTTWITITYTLKDGSTDKITFYKP